MPLQSLNLPASIHSSLRKATRNLIKKNLFASEKIDVSYDVGFCMYIQSVPKKQLRLFSFGRPEGIRAFIQSGKNVIAAADFLFTGKKLKLSYIHQGDGLKILLSVLNKLEKKYAGKKGFFYAELIYFLLAPGPYLLIRSKTTKQFYYSTAKKVTPVSVTGLKKQVTKILDQHFKTK
jgi:hypothetical protein